MILTGRIFDIHKVSDKVSQIVIRKKAGDKYVLVAPSLFGFWNTKMQELNLQPKQRVKGNLYINSKLWNGRYYNDVFYKDVYYCAEDEIPVSENRLISGRIFDIIIVSDVFAQVVLKKKVDDKLQPLAINLFGVYKDKFLAMGLKPKDKIKAKVYFKSKMYKDKYYTDVYFKDVTHVEDVAEPIENSLFQQRAFIEGEIVDTDSGEIFEG